MKRLTLFTITLLMASFLSAQEMLTIDQTLDIAMKNSPDIRQAENSMNRSLQNLNAQKARQKSQFSLRTSPLTMSYENKYDTRGDNYYDDQNFGSNADFRVLQPLVATGGELLLSNNFGYGYNKNNNSVDGSWNETNNFSNNLSLSFNQPLFTYNNLKVQYEELKLDYENSAIQFALTKMNLERQVRQLFYNVYQQQQSLLIAQEDLKNNEESYDIIKNKVDGGLSALEELYQAELNVATSKSDLYNQQVQLQNAKDNFLYQIGDDIDKDIMVITDITVNKVDVDPKIAVEMGLKNRLELRQREIDIQNSTFSLIRAKTTNEFSGSVAATVGVYSNSGDINTMFNDQNTRVQPNLSFSFDIPLFDWGERKATIKSAELALDNSKMSMEFQQSEIVLGIREIIRNLTNLYNQVEIARKSVENAQLTYDINLERYKNGDLTSMDLRLFQNQLTSQKNSLTNTIINYNLELLNLKIQTLYDFVNNKPVIPEVINNDKK
ncbi:TolC family protein [Saccharicrinis sp. FJH2]|uniref:TolC family protein n=1 Tax=unclassified Saccharicrinis TaxID=2646859 RepID=UPI0035D4C905